MELGVSLGKRCWWSVAQAGQSVCWCMGLQERWSIRVQTLLSLWLVKGFAATWSHCRRVTSEGRMKAKALLL